MSEGSGDISERGARNWDTVADDLAEILGVPVESLSVPARPRRLFPLDFPLFLLLACAGAAFLTFYLSQSLQNPQVAQIDVVQPPIPALPPARAMLAMQAPRPEDTRPDERATVSSPAPRAIRVAQHRQAEPRLDRRPHGASRRDASDAPLIEVAEADTIHRSPGVERAQSFSGAVQRHEIVRERIEATDALRDLRQK